MNAELGVQTEPDRRAPKGVLVAVGGNEDKEHDLFILRSIKSLVKKELVRIEVITTASEIPEEVGQLYVKAFEKIGGNHLGLMNIRTRDQAEEPEMLSRIKEADIIFFSGGDQLRITSILGGSPILKEIRRRYMEEFCIVAGTSAGASAMSETMIYDGDSGEALLKGTVHITGGIGLINRVIIDSHFIKRGRFSRLMQVISMNPGYIGLGLGEDTGVVVERGRTLRAIGNGLVVIFDGQHMRYSNVTRIRDGEAIAIDNMHVHTIVKGHGYDLFERRYLKPEDMECLKLLCHEEGN
ncbi:MAG: cyanophycinase [Thermoplasmatota archaeon]